MKKGLICLLFLFYISSALLSAGCGYGRESESNLPQNQAWTASATQWKREGISSVVLFEGNVALYPVLSEEPGTGGWALSIVSEVLGNDKKDILYQENNQERQKLPMFMTAAGDGKIVLLNYISGGEGEEAAYELFVFDRENGAVCFDITQPLQNIDQMENGKTAVHLAALEADNAGNIYLAVNGTEAALLTFDIHGAFLSKTETEGKILALCTLENGSCFFVCSERSVEGEAIYLQEIDPETGRPGKRYDNFPDQTPGFLISGWGANQILVSSGDTFYRYDTENETCREEGSWLRVGIDAGAIRELAVLPDGRIVAWVKGGQEEERDELVFLTPAQPEKNVSLPSDGGAENAALPEMIDTTTLIYATQKLNNEMRSWIVEFNKSHPDIKIEVREYGQMDYETGIMQLNADLVSGHPPDLIALDGLDVNAYIAKGILEDLYPLLDKDAHLSRDSFTPGLLSLYEQEGKLYGIAAGISMETLMGRKVQMGEREDWTPEKMQEYLLELPENEELIENLSPIGLMRIFLEMEMDSFVNWQDGVCSFDGEKFMQLLELANEIRWRETQESTEEKIASGSLLLYRAYLYDSSDYFAAVALFGNEETVCIGYPSPDGGHAVLNAFLPVGITSTCENKEAAWEFAASLLSDEFQNTCLPPGLFTANRDMLQKEFDEYFSGIREIAGVVVTKTQLEEIYEVIRTGVNGQGFDRTIWNIIEEEVTPYFNGEREAEDVVNMIQRRVSLYLSEQE
ncbi:MAG: extracellular solute-binding protein [Lachnospiraceae bacterium]|jgi:ABC-type glycerol-3-phosphate transport system substrate-binding protein|nr:extracellular solute-binding protein [Lachnospiraceae bacterium]